MEEIKKCENCQTFKPFHVIKAIGYNNPKCAVCGLPVPAVVSIPHSITSDLALAKSYLKETGLSLTPDAVRDALWAGNPGHITGATLGRKFREAAAKGELTKTYYVNDKGRKIAQYSWRNI